MFQADARFEKPLACFDFFRVEGVPQGLMRYKQLGKVVGALQKQHKVDFEVYTPRKHEDFVIGHLEHEPWVKGFQVDGMSVEWLGKKDLAIDSSSKRTLVGLLNKSKRRDLRARYWSAGFHTFYPRYFQNLNTFYPGCGLGFFRGPRFRYNITSDGRILLALDTSTHYIKLEAYLSEIRRRGQGDLGWFREEVERRKERYEREGREFRGLHFYYILAENEVLVNEIDERPISQIPLSKPVTIGGNVCRTISEFLKERYKDRRVIQDLDETQPGLAGFGFTYAPQFLHRTVEHDEIDETILNEQTFHMDTRRGRGKRDRHRPAWKRWGLLQQLLQAHFTYVNLGSEVVKFKAPLRFAETNHFDKPRLHARPEGKPVSFQELSLALANGPHKDPQIGQVLLYSTLEEEDAGLNFQYYGALVEYAKRRFGVTLPDKPNVLDRDLSAVEQYVKRANLAGTLGSNTACIAVIPRDWLSWHRFLTLMGSFGIPVQGADVYTVREICASRRAYVLENLCAALIAKAGGIPWVLYDHLNYECYAAVDVGRSKAANWALTIVFDRNGRFETKRGELIRGEDLEQEAIAYCVQEASHYSKEKKDLVLLRDGTVYPQEEEAFSAAVADSPFANCSIVSVKKDVPYRIFRELDGQVLKPNSGDYFVLDNRCVVLCSAGADEYEHGMPQPIEIEVLTSKGAMDVLSVARDAFFLTYLNWGSPRQSYSVPAPVRLAHSMASDLAAGVRRAGEPF